MQKNMKTGGWETLLGVPLKTQERKPSEPKTARRIVDAEVARREYEARKRAEALARIAANPRLPFSRWTFADSSQALIDRWGRPLWRWEIGQGLSVADVSEKLPVPVRREWIFTRANEPFGNSRGIEQALAQLAEWGVSYDERTGDFQP